MLYDIKLPNKFYECLLEIDLRLLLKRIILQQENVEKFDIKVIEKKIKGIDSNFIKKHKLSAIYAKFRSIYNIVNFVFPNIWKPWEIGMVANGFWKNDQNKKEALQWFVDKLVQTKIIEDVEQLPRVCTYKLFEEYKLSGLLADHFNYSPYEAINFLYPNKFVKWEFTLPTSYYNNKENVKEIMEWFIDKLIEDKYINTIDEIPDKVNINTFREYNLYSFLINCFSGVSYDAFNYIFPNRWYPWEFKSCPTGYWENIANVKKALLWLINRLKEDGKIEKNEDVKYLPITKTLEEYKLSTLAKEYVGNYHSLFSLIVDGFKPNDFTHRIKVEGMAFDSREEYMLHNWFTSNINKKVRYIEKYNDLKFYNEETNENYVPDWIIDDNLVVEYFGWYNENSTTERFIEYNKKTKRKIKYFSELDGYSFIALFPQDLSDNFKGVKDKFKKYITQTESVTTIRQLSH